jgi:peptide/nickel transport system substrate-binding protein
MRRKHVFSLLMSSSGIALLVAATIVGTASSATRRVNSARALRGGTLRVDQAGVFDTLDPGLAYTLNDWQVLYTTQLLLVDFPTKAGQAGEQLFPEAAKAFPTVSNDGKTVTFHLRRGLRLSDGSAVTAKCFQRAFERVLSPKMFAHYGIFDRLNKTLVGGPAFASGKTRHISGIQARGLTLTFHLRKPSPAFLSVLAIPWFGAVKPNLPYTTSPNGIARYASAGPYYIAVNRGRRLVLKRNPYYHGARPANPSEIVITSYRGSNGEAALLRVEQNQVDYDMSGVPTDDVQAVAQKYGYPSNRHSRFHVGSQGCVVLEVLNNARPPTNDARVREAINYAIGRASILGAGDLGPYAGIATGQMLVPGVPGYKKLDVYGDQPNVEKAKEVGGSALENAAPLDIYYRAGSQFQTAMAQLEQSELQQIGLTVNLVQSDPANYFGQLEQKGGRWNIAYGGVFCPDVPDGFDYINALLEGRPPYAFRNPLLTQRMDHAASLTGQARARAYGALDELVMTKYAPVIPLYIPNFRYLVSKRVRNVAFSHYLGGPMLNAMSVR